MANFKILVIFTFFASFLNVAYGIVGGQVAPTGMWPWQAAVHRSISGDLCRGSLINNLWVLSAAHCVVNDLNTTQYLVFLGGNLQDLSNPNSNSSPFEVAQIIFHPSYDSTDNSNDIALIKLSTPITPSQDVAPINISVISPTMKKAFGLGDVGGLKKINVQKQSLNLLNSLECSNIFGRTLSNVICTEVSGKKKIDCYDNSGSGLVSRDNNNPVLIGIASEGVSCGEPKEPGIYTDVAAYSGWIYNTINGF